MWEITPVGKTRDILFFDELKTILKDKYNSQIMMAITFNNDLYCSIAVKDKRYVRFVKSKIFETIIKIVKCEYFENNLNIFSIDKSLNSFILSCILKIDLFDEIEYSLERFKLTKIVHIRSFVYFKLSKIINIWSKIASYLNSNFQFNCKDGLCLEFLKFLADNSDANIEVFYLKEQKNNLELIDVRNKIIKQIPKSDEIGILVSLILYSPKKLIINCIDSLSEKVSNLITYIFDDKVSVLY